MAHYFDRHINDLRRTNSIRFGDFSGGVNTSVSPEFIAENELAWAQNWEFDHLSGAIKGRDGTDTVLTLSGEPTAIFWNATQEAYLVSEKVQTGESSFEHRLYAVTCTEGTWAEVLIGTLSGDLPPQFASFGDAGETLVASGGELQQVAFDTGWSITDVSDLTSYEADGYENVQLNCAYVWTRHGHVGVGNVDSDVIQYSGLGDPGKWNCSASGADKGYFFQVGYKESLSTIAIVPLVTDLVVFKAAPDGSEGKAYRVISDPWDENFQVVLQASDAVCVAPRGACVVAGEAFYLDRRGLWGFGATSNYGDVAGREPGQKLNKDISNALSYDGWCVPIPSKRAIFISPNNGEAIFVMNVINEAIFPWGFGFTVTAASDNGEEVLLCCGDKKLRKLNSMSFRDDEAFIPCSIKTATITNTRPYLIKRIGVAFIPITGVSGRVQLGRIRRDFSFGAVSDVAREDRDLARMDEDILNTEDSQIISYRTNGRFEEGSMILSITNGKFLLRYIFVEMAELGGA